MTRPNITKEMLEQVYNNPKLTLKEKLKVLGCSDNHMYKKLRDYEIPVLYRNKRNNVIVNINGESKCLKEWCDILKINYKYSHNQYKKKGIEYITSKLTKAKELIDYRSEHENIQQVLDEIKRRVK